MDGNGFSWHNDSQTITSSQIFNMQSDASESQVQSNYVQPENSPTTINLQAHPTNLDANEPQDMHAFSPLRYSSDDEQYGNNTEQCVTEATSDGEEFLRSLKERHGHDAYKAKQADAQASTSSSTNPAQASGSTAHLGATTSSPALSDYVGSLIQKILEEKYDLIPKDAAENQNATDDKSKKKRKHRHNRHRSKNGEMSRHNSSSSLNDLPEPSTSTPKRSDGKKGSNSDVSSCGSSNHSARKRKQKYRLDYSEDVDDDDDFCFNSPRQPPKTKPRRRKDDQVDASVRKLKNTDKSLYLSSQRAKQCPLCQRVYKRMVSHFRRVHTNHEVLVARVSPSMAESLLKAQLPAPIKYVNSSGMQYLKMMCPFCDVVKDFFAPYWGSHMRTHTGEYVNKCGECFALSMSATHCGLPTAKPKCNLYTMGLTAYICLRCNYMQIDKKKIVAHLKKQHNRDQVPITSMENEYRKVVLIPPLKEIRIQANPNVDDAQVLFVEPSVGQQPLIAGSHSSVADESPSRVQIIDNVLIRSRNSNPNGIVGDDSTVAEVETNATESEAQYFYAFEEDENDDFKITDGNPSGATSSYSNYSVNIKVDTIDDETLQNVAGSYNRNNANMEVVRPWIEDDYGRKPAINVITQFALYKCMHEQCIFATNLLEQWFVHMTVHIQLIDFFKKQEALDKSTRSRLIKFRECSYCGYEAKSDSNVLRHLEEEHRRSIFQCSLCFYRTIEHDNMMLHMTSYHPANGSQHEVYVCGDTREFNQQDDETLDQDVENNVEKMKCGQGGCTEEYACYNSLYAHLSMEHRVTGTYVCPYCQQTMGLDESMITEHLSKHAKFEEFQCLKCNHGFDNVNAMRDHMSVAHPSNYLFVGARQAHGSGDEIQIVYVGGAQPTKALILVECAQPEVLIGMDPKVLDMKQQLEKLKQLQLIYGNNIKKVTNKIPQISIRDGDHIELKFIKYEEYAQMNLRQKKEPAPRKIEYRCITAFTLKDLPAIAAHIDRAKEIDDNECQVMDSVASMLNHRFRAHMDRPMVFVQFEQQQWLQVQKIVRCTFQCELCGAQVATRKNLAQHFFDRHRNKWFAARICIKSHVIESNDPQQPVQMHSESLDYFFCSYLECAQAECEQRRIGTRTQAIAHYDEYHNDIGSKIDAFQVQLRENLLPISEDVEAFVQESQHTHQMYLFECKHCGMLFDSRDAIDQHFDAERAENAEVVLRFAVKRLFRCLQDNVIRTNAGLKQYESANPHVNKKMFLPVDMLWPRKSCGLCGYDYERAGDLVAHYKRMHPEPDKLSPEQLDSFGPDTIEMHLCKFVAKCCYNDERDLLLNIVEHALNCPRRFVCAQCPDRKFVSHVSFVMHRIQRHGQTLAEIINELHNLKKLLALLADAQIILPNGLVVTMMQVRETPFGFELLKEITALAHQLWEQEKFNVKQMTNSLTPTV